MPDAAPTLPRSTAPAEPQLARNLVRFGRALRRLGVGATTAHIELLTRGLEHVELRSRSEFRAAARAVLVQRREHLEIFDRLFDLFWHADAAAPRKRIEMGRLQRRLAQQRSQQALAAEPAASPAQIETEIASPQQEFSAQELLRHKDFARLTDHERAAIEALMRTHSWSLPKRQTRRWISAPRGPAVDLRRSLRTSLRTGGEMVCLERRQRRTRQRPLVVICDISGSMEAYSRLLLQFTYGLRTTTERLEAFVFGTRLTRISRELRSRDPDRALQDAAARIADWGGGTRIGDSFERFNRDWGRRVLGQGAVVCVLSDAWDRGDLQQLDRQTARLRRTCLRLMWLNPLLGSEGYQPLSSGIRTVLPYCDDFLPVHNLASLEQLGRLLASLDKRDK